MRARALTMPWAPDRRLYCVPGRLTVKLTLGEAPDAIPAAGDVRLGVAQALSSTRVGSVDRVLRHFSNAVEVSRVHMPATAQVGRGTGRRRYDDIEHALGLARIFTLRVDPSSPITDMVDALRQLAEVESAAPEYVCALPFATMAVPELAQFDPDHAWSARAQISAAEAMAYESGDPAVIVAIVDTGVDEDHSELRVHLRPGYDTVKLGRRDLASGVELVGDIVDDDTDPRDEVGHGTACAGIIGASGEHIPPGLAGDCGVLPMRALCSAKMPGRTAPVGIGSLSDIDDACKRAIDLGARVLNMSFGTPRSSLDPNDPLPHADVVTYGIARGCVMVAASGNTGATEEFYPAAHDGVIAVGAVGPDDRPSSFTTTGPHVCLCAPGERVVSSGIGGYQSVTGTSFAAPFVAAAAALILSRANQRAWPIDEREVKRILSTSARAFGPGVKPGSGAGVLDAVAALRLLDSEIDHGLVAVSPRVEEPA